MQLQKMGNVDQQFSELQSQIVELKRENDNWKNYAKNLEGDLRTAKQTETQLGLMKGDNDELQRQFSLLSKQCQA